MSHDNFPPPYEQDPRQRRAGSVFDRISPAEPRPSQQQSQQPRARPQPPPPMPQQPERRHENALRAVPPRSRPQRREEEARSRPGPSHQQPRYEVEDYDSDERQRSCPTGTTPRIAENMHTAPGRNPSGKDITRPRQTGPRPGKTIDMGVRRPLLIKGMSPQGDESKTQRGPGKDVDTEEIGKLRMRLLSTR
ncbi:basic salivary proline-rich protein 1-like [Olea europaea var. sylvestris]|uniref:basic salivary proline-rich protein 1-like n=1 Tax=Olea europaea var. sylvestris TaxID=158386 RepID=UPI000C1D5AD8|nr:basic salivary proline-rich protein 1-like [Olea europaea var. sylvestris]